MAKRPGSLVLTFSKKNGDIRNLLEDKKSKDETFVTTDYICESIRFYEKHKNSIAFNDLQVVQKLIDDRLKEFMKVNSTLTFGLAEIEPKSIVEEKIILNELKINMNTLESNIDDIPIDED